MSFLSILSGALALVFFVASPAAGWASETNPSQVDAMQVYGLQEAVDRGITHYPGMAIAQRAIEIAKQQVNQARHSWFLPTINVTSLFGPIPDVPDGSGPPNFPKVDQDFTQSFGIFFRVELEALQPVYTFGRLSNVNRLARTGYEASQWGAKDQLFELVFNIKRVFFGLASLVEIANFLIDIEKKLDVVEGRIKALIKENSSEVTESDRLKVQVFRADLEDRKLETQLGQRRLRYALALLLGYGDQVEGWDIGDKRLKRLKADPFDMSIALEWAGQNNAKLQQLKNLEVAKDALHKVARANLFPFFFIGGQFLFSVAPGREDLSNPFLNDQFNDIGGGAAFGLRQSLDFHILNDKLRKAKAELDQARFQRKLGEQALLGDLRAKVVSSELAEKRYAVVSKGLRSARSWVAAELNNYEFGLTPTEDVLEAFIAYAKAKLDHINATLKYNIAIAEVSRATMRELHPINFKGDGRE